MADKATPSADDIIEIPSDEIALGHDADGLPKTISTAHEADPVVEAKDETAAKLEALQREKEDLARERDARAAEAAEHAKQLAAEKAARLAAEEKATKATGISWESHWERVNSDAANVESGLSQIKQLVDAAKRDLRSASEASDHDKVAELTEQIGTLTNNRIELERAERITKAEVEKARRGYQSYAEGQEKTTKEVEPEVKKDPEPKQLSPDEWIRQFPRKTSTWLREHPDYVVGGPKHDKLLKFAKEWVDDYGQPTLHTPAFIDAMNKEFDPQDNEEPTMAEEVEEAPVEKPKPKTRALPSAPVSRGNSVFSSSNPNAEKIWLEPKLKNMLVTMGLDPTKWALQAREDIKAGKLPKEYLDPGYDRGF